MRRVSCVDLIFESDFLFFFFFCSCGVRAWIHGITSTNMKFPTVLAAAMCYKFGIALPLVSFMSVKGRSFADDSGSGGDLAYAFRSYSWRP